MARRYAELRPGPRLAPWVECYWAQEIVETKTLTRVLPDGCADILFSPAGLTVVGLMTCAATFEQHPGESYFGVRFRPGMATAFVREAALLTDRIEPLETFWGKNARTAQDGLAEERTLAGRAAWIDRFLHPAAHPAPAAMSPRHRRRLCVERTGVPPKHLSRILRFRRLLERARSGPPEWAQLAIDCGYFDQAHMIRDFQEFAGCTPGRYLQSLRTADR